MLTRKQLLKLFAFIPFTGEWARSRRTSKVLDTGLAQPASAYRRKFFQELGLRPFINGRGTITTLSGSLMLPEVMEAMHYASQQFVRLNELNEKVGERIAQMLHCEDALVSAGAASAITLGTAAAVTGIDRENIRVLPNIPGPQREVILPKGHRIYEHQMTACGVKLVEVDDATQMEQAINENTVMAFYFNSAHEQCISREEFIQIAAKHHIPTFNDAAADVPPVENLFRYTEMGFDMVTFSGGKGLRGPQSAGLLLGRKELIEAARLNHSPYGSIGRGMKVNKEEILGMMVALEVYLAKDHGKERQEWEGWIEQIAAAARTVPSVETEKYTPPVANHVPHLRITWDPEVVRISPVELRRQLRNGEPSIEISSGRDAVELNVFMMKPDEVRIVAVRIKELLEQAA